MLTSLAEFKYYQTFRVPVESRDDVLFMVEVEEDHGKHHFLSKVKLLDVSMTGLGFCSTERIPVGTEIQCSIQFRRFRHEFSCSIVRVFRGTQLLDEDSMSYGVEIDKDEYPQMKKFLEAYIGSLPPERVKDSLIHLALTERYSTAEEGFEMFSLLLSLFKDITQFGNKEKFIENMLEEITRILNAQRASIFLINTETNELEAVAALGIDKDLLKFDYRKGIAGSVFTTGVSLNIDTKNDKVRFSEEIDKVTGFSTKSIICSPIFNREDKIVGVIEVLNKRNEDRFTFEDEKTMKVLALICSSVFHHFNPVSEKTLIRRFSTPYDREFALIGRSNFTGQLRRLIVKLKDLDTPLWIHGEVGVGKKLLARIIHNEGKRGLNSYHCLSCKGVDKDHLQDQLFGGGGIQGVLELTQGGTVLLDEISYMPLKMQQELIQALEEKRIPGSTIALDVRVIFSSSRDLEKMVEEGEFYPPLFNYMKTSDVEIQPLRDRQLDIEDLIIYFLKKECKHQGFLLKELSPAIKDIFFKYPWPGNMSELEKAIQKLVLYNPKAHIINDLGPNGAEVIDAKLEVGTKFGDIPFVDDFKISLKDRVALIEREMIYAEIKRLKGNKSKAAEAMGMSREALRKKLLQSDEILVQLKGVAEVKKVA